MKVNVLESVKAHVEEEGLGYTEDQIDTIVSSIYDELEDELTQRLNRIKTYLDES